MIWYACKKCGKKLGRSESQSGTLVFCECGFGNRVPWSSTVPEPAAEEAPLPSRQPLPSIPLRFEDDDRPSERGNEALPPLRAKPKREYRRVNPKFCLNHDEMPSEHTCGQCRLPFCSKCVLELQGEMICGPCKNFKVRGLQRPSRVSPLAIIAAVVALVSGPICFCLSMMGAITEQQGGGIGSVVFGLVGLLLPVGALVMSCFALRDIETKPRLGGRALAMTGTAAGLIGVLWSVTVILIMLVKFIQK